MVKEILTFVQGWLFPTKEHWFVVSLNPNEYLVTLFQVLRPSFKEVMHFLEIHNKNYTYFLSFSSSNIDIYIMFIVSIDKDEMPWVLLPKNLSYKATN